MVTRRPAEASKSVLLVHPDLGTLSALQSSLSASGLRAVVARDLPTTLLAITQHYFDLAVVGSRITEEGDGWSVAAVLRMVFPNAFIAVIAPRTDVMTLKAAINSGIDEVYENSSSTQVISASILTHTGGRRSSSHSTSSHQTIH